MNTVSVIIPTYNRAKLLRQAILSVLAQTYCDFELIVVDDGSTDNTRAVVMSINDSRVRYIWQNNQERSIARNNGVREANGELIAFLDSDDVWLPDKLAGQVELMNRDLDVVLVYGASIRIDDQNRMLSALDLLNQSNEPEVRDCREESLLCCCANPSAALLRRKAFEDAGEFDPSLSLAEDWDLWIRLSELGAFCSMRSLVSATRVHSANSINDVVGMMKGDLAVIEKTAARRGAEMDQRIKLKAELAAYIRATARAVYLNMTEAAQWIEATFSISSVLQTNADFREVFVGYVSADACQLRDPDAKAAWLDKSVRFINSLGGSESQRAWLASFWATQVHLAFGLGDNRLAVKAFLRLIACHKIGVVDRGLISSIIRAVLAMMRRPRGKRRSMPREAEISTYLQELREADVSEAHR